MAASSFAGGETDVATGSQASSVTTGTKRTTRTAPIESRQERQQTEEEAPWAAPLGARPGN